MAQKMNEHKIVTKKPNEMNALTLAYIGDAIYELYIRKHLVAQGGKPNVLHKRAISYVSANSQAKVVHWLMEQLSETELDIVKRGRNAKSYTSPKNADMINYRYSTAFEALLGYLYLMDDMERLEEIIKKTINYMDNQDGENNGK